MKPHFVCRLRDLFPGTQSWLINREREGLVWPNLTGSWELRHANVFAVQVLWPRTLLVSSSFQGSFFVFTLQVPAAVSAGLKSSLLCSVTLPSL